MIKKLTCIVCPMGCELEVSINEGVVECVKGNSCKRGEKYANEECTAPKRTLTTTVMCSNGSLLPVKTNVGIPKEKLFECMQEINKCRIDLPIFVGDVIIKDILGLGADIVAAADNNN